MMTSSIDCYALIIIILLVAILVISVMSYQKKFTSEGFTTSSSTYELVDSWSGTQFLPSGSGNPDNLINKKWYFYSGPIYNQGMADYVKDNTDGLVTVNTSGQLRIDVSPTSNNTTTSRVRKTVRLTTRLNSKTTGYTGGVFIIDADHIPEGKGTWPAFWLANTGNWPTYGEIDIIEMVNSFPGATYGSKNTSWYQQNQISIHTGAGCVQPNASSTYVYPTMTKTTSTLDCNNDQCGFKVRSTSSFGNGFNKAGGGVYVCEWIVNDVINVWFFPRSSVPSNINKSMTSISTSSLGTPTISFSACSGYFQQLHLIVNTALCGSWAGALFKDSNYTSGSTASANCIDYLNDNANTYSDAYWLINFIKVFQINKTNGTV